MKILYNFFLKDPMEYITSFLKLNFLNTQTLLTGFVGAGISFISPAGPFVLAVFVLSVFDLITGVMAASKKRRDFKLQYPGVMEKYPSENFGARHPLEITSRGLFRTSQKLAIFSMLIVAALVLEQNVLKPLFPIDIPLMLIVAFPICWSEFKSLFENARIVTGIDAMKFVDNFGDQMKDKTEKK